MRKMPMTRRDVWILVFVAVTQITAVFGAMAGGLAREVQMSAEHQYALARQQQWISGVPIILGALGIFAGVLWNIWQTRKVKLGQEVLERRQTELKTSQEKMEKAVNGLATRAEESAGKVGEAKGADEERERADAAARLLAEQTKAAILAERTKAEAATAAQRPAVAPPPAAVIDPSTETTSVRIAQAIEQVPKAIEDLPPKGPA